MLEPSSAMESEIMNAPVDSEQNVERVHAELATTTPTTQTEEKIGVEEFTITGDALVTKIKELIHQGNIRRIILKNEEGRTLIEIPSVRLYSPSWLLSAQLAQWSLI
jgi:Domain of unknown function (DUF4342)